MCFSYRTVNNMSCLNFNAGSLTVRKIALILSLHFVILSSKLIGFPMKSIRTGLLNFSRRNFIDFLMFLIVLRIGVFIISFPHLIFTLIFLITDFLNVLP